MERSERQSPWVCTRSGRRFRPLEPRAEDVDLGDIAGALAVRYRFAGQTREPYTVAQHCVEVSLRLEPSPTEALWGLLHDASEAWLPDVQRPLKPLLYFGVGVREFLSFGTVERRILYAVAERFGLPRGIPPVVEIADDRELARERRDLFGPEQPAWPELVAEPYPEPLVVMAASEALRAFVDRFEHLQRLRG